MKKILILGLCLFLCSCSSKEDINDGLEDYNENPAFDIRIPKKWKVLENKEAVLPKPNTGNIELAVSSTAKIDDFANSLVIISEELPDKNTSASEYISSVNLSLRDAVKTYIAHKELLIVFGEGEKAPSSKIYTFDAKYNDKTPLLKYVQTAMICEDKAYLLTLAIPNSVNDTVRYQYLLSTFRCK